ncbi:gamma-glutamyl-gamma-aminobutyrate hydrolase family protein [Actinocorallia sp. A-T 12471]|uniref:gamma-glutamyl-gamma-aminobutyrate hydrolase family protein n=1 Tax=Actinocorallia sp. A-T 12471 TaxID=3089813 RepID=UPI0029CFB3C3|nr:gamma-glutamyl-gamma-aminobutyrate hydrolase family protein [Actinocorallia sp. A-T 12471]MDX6741346.1 gamma-glutamyl-gamma-aminobutyrate hydrolase family protein [Actinocorallia sp. A-T 12471]
MARPLIGVTTYQDAARWGAWVREAALLPVSYQRSVERAGGLPVLLPPLADLEGAPELVARLDALVVAGGPDIDPSRYGARPHERTGEPNQARDRYESALLHAAVDAHLPFLAVCRGMQLLNVVRGGTLIQHLPDEVGHEGHAPVPGRFSRHRVRIAPESRTGKAMGALADVPTYHHQAVGRLGSGLVAVAWAADKVIEAVELEGHPFGVGVQWHPEEGDDLSLFQALVAQVAVAAAGEADAVG